MATTKTAAKKISKKTALAIAERWAKRTASFKRVNCDPKANGASLTGREQYYREVTRSSVSAHMAETYPGAHAHAELLLENGVRIIVTISVSAD